MDNQENSDNTLLQVGNIIVEGAVTWKLTEVDIPEKKDNKFLQFVASYGLTSVCESLLLRGTDINATDSLGWTPLMQASRAGHIDVVKLLINSGAKVEIFNKHGVDAFTLAAANGNLQIMQILWHQRVNLEQNSNNLRTALEMCCLNGHLNCAKWLVSTTCVDFNAPSVQNGQTPLMLAALGGHMEVAKLLLDRGCDLTVHNNFHQTALDIAVFKNDGNMAEMFTMRTLRPTALQLQFKSSKPSLSSGNLIKCPGLSDKENVYQFSGNCTRICNNPEHSLKILAENKDKINCRLKLSPKSGIDIFSNAYFQFPSVSYNEFDSDQSSSSSNTSASHLLCISSANSEKTLQGIISPRYFSGNTCKCQKSPNSVKKRQFSAVKSCSTWLTKFVKRRSKSVDDSCFSSVNSSNIKLFKKKGIDFSHIFDGLGLQEYWPIFKKQDLDLASFLTLTKDDLETMGIKYEADKCKILYAVEQLKRSPL